MRKWDQSMADNSLDQKKIWDYFQTEGVESFSQNYQRLKYILRHITSGMRVLNIGVGNGVFEKIALQKKIDIHCIDPSEKAIEALKSSLGLADKASVGLSQNIDYPDGYFDAVVMSEVLEHLDDLILGQTIAECARVLRNGGYFYGTVPADENLVDNNVVCPDCGKLFHRWGHVQQFSYSRLRNIISTSAFHVVITRKNFSNWKTLNWKGRISSAAKTVALAIGVKGRGENFFFIAQKLG